MTQRRTSGSRSETRAIPCIRATRRLTRVRYNAYARDLTNGTNQKLNARGTAGGPGGFDPGTNTVIFQEWANTSAIRMFDLDTQTSVHVPGAINSPKWEWEPRISTAYITFFRNTKVNGVRYADLLLYNRVSGDVTKLARLPSANFNTNDTSANSM